MTREVDFEEFIKFFEDQWATAIKDCHCRTTSAVLDIVISDLCRGLQDMELKEVWRSYKLIIITIIINNMIIFIHNITIYFIIVISTLFVYHILFSFRNRYVWNILQLN